MASIWATPDDTLPSTTSDQQPEQTHIINPHLLQPILYVSGITEAVTDSAVVEALSECLRVKPCIERQLGSTYAEATGYVEFESIDRGTCSLPFTPASTLTSFPPPAEKAYATVNSTFFPSFNCSLSLSLFPPSTSPDPKPISVPRLFKSLPLHLSLGDLFDLCRPFGPIYRISFQYSAPYPPHSAQEPVYKGWAVVEWYEEDHAKYAESQLHCSELEGNTIIVQIYEPSRAPRRSDPKSQSQWASASTFVPSSGIGQGLPSQLNATVPSFTPQPQSHTMQRSFSNSSTLSNGFGVTLPAPLSPTQSLHSSQTASLIDPCNLFIKNLSPILVSSDLHSLFSPYGTIISARVMNDEMGKSKEFGFVSFGSAEEADQARRGMDGMMLDGKKLTVRLHEPKKVREGRLRGNRYVSGASSGGSQMGYEDQLSARVASMTTSPERSRDASPSSQPLSRDPSTSTEDEPITPQLSEKERLEVAVKKIEPNADKAKEVLELMQGLPKKERAMCLFNNEYLKTKVADALLVLSSSSDDEDATPAPLIPAPSTPPKPTHLPSSLEKLSLLPAAEIISLINNNWVVSLGLTKVDPAKSKQTDEFMDGLDGKPTHDVKQKLGDRLFKAIKAFGVKGAPRITIALLDTEDLRALAHLIDYPEVLREKVGPLVTAK